MFEAYCWHRNGDAWVKHHRSFSTAHLWEARHVARRLNRAAWRQRKAEHFAQKLSKTAWREHRGAHRGAPSRRCRSGKRAGDVRALVSASPSVVSKD